MKTIKVRITPLIEKVRSSFWFVPSIMVMASCVLAVACIYIDITHVNQSYLPLFYATDISAVRSLLGTMAASMVTVTSIAFSITIVTLTLASSQFGPRLMRNFMMDGGTQFVLGMFISTFIYCISIFCAISVIEPYSFQPGISVFVAVALTCISVIVLIYFIHHVAKSIQADIVIDQVYCELKQNIVDHFPDKTSTQPITQCDDNISDIMLAYPIHNTVTTSHSGYVQLIDKESLFELTVDENVVIKLAFSPGDFVVKGATVADVYTHQPLPDNFSADVEQHLMLGSCRTPVQDPEFAVHQLVEIAMRALSPGINDPYTAITCIDKLSSVLCDLTRKAFPKSQKFDSAGTLRLLSQELTFVDIANAAFNQIRQHAHTNTAVTIRLLDSLHMLALQASQAEHSEFVMSQTNVIKQQHNQQSINAHDSLAITERIDRNIGLLNNHTFTS